jgi:radical SAM protein with 4Fe4S-binding SPASM domain
MKAILKENFVLRGWDKLPFCLVERPDNRLFFLNGETFDAVSMCNGSIDLSLPVISDNTRKIVEELKKNGIVEECAEGASLTDDQEYRCYSNRCIKMAHWSITGRCNYRCRHCFLSAPEAKFGELPHDTVMDIVRQLGECGIGQVSLTGGEPLVRADFLEIVDALIDQHIVIKQIYSNGALVTPKLLSELARRNVFPEFNMSYDGDEGWHDWMRGIPNATEAVLRAFDLCYENGFKTGAEMCLYEGNKHLLRQSINTLAEHHCANLKTNPVSETELWKKNGGKTVSIPELYEIYLRYIPEYFEDGAPIGLMLGGFFSCNKGKKEWFSPAEHGTADHPCDKDVVCGHARGTLYISPDGRMLPCMPLASCRIQEEFPKITEIGLKEGLTDSAYMKLITTKAEEILRHNPECAACEYRNLCRGGCRAAALETTPDDVLGQDRAACLFFKGGYRKKIEQELEKIGSRETAQAKADAGQ